LAGNEEDTVTAAEESTVHNETTADYTPRPRSAGDHDTTITTDQSSSMYHEHQTHQDSSVLDDNDDDVTGSTPRPPATKTLSSRPQFANLSSPYEALKREYDAKHGSTTPRAATTDQEQEEEEDTELLFQQHTARLPDMSMTPRGSFDAASGPRRLDFHKDKDKDKPQQNRDPLLHRLADKNYRIAATPHRTPTTAGAAAGFSPVKWKVDKLTTTTPGKGKDKQPASRPIWEDSPTSSPEMAPPQLRSAAFMSPAKGLLYRGKMAAAAAAAAPRTPGVSVQTPATGRKTRDVFASAAGAAGAGGGRQGTTSRYDFEDEITWESEGEEFGGLSPPKTIQFALPPGRLLQTPGMLMSSFFLLSLPVGGWVPFGVWWLT
jgi:DASH complex subunit ASK1